MDRKEKGPGTWRSLAAALIILGGMADASLAHPDRLDPFDVILFASGFASVLLFLLLERITPLRLGAIATLSVASAVAVVVTAARGLTGFEVGVAVLDVALRLGLVANLVALAYRHLAPSRGPPAPP